MDADTKLNHPKATTIPNENCDVHYTREHKPDMGGATTISHEICRINDNITKGHEPDIDKTTIRSSEANSLDNTKECETNDDNSSTTSYETNGMHVPDGCEHKSSSNMTSIEIESMRLCCIAYMNGFDQRTIKLMKEFASNIQKHVQKHVQKLVNTFSKEIGCSVYITGSGSEGIYSLGTDTDILISLDSLVCYDTEDDAPTDPSKYAVMYQADRENSPPGYAKITARPCHLCNRKCWNCHHRIGGVLQDTVEMKTLFLSVPNLFQSKQFFKNGPANSFSEPTTSETVFESRHFVEKPVHFADILKKALNDFHTKEGISSCQYHEYQYFFTYVNKILQKKFDVKLDVVFGIPFCSSKIMLKWLNRRRKYEWPSTQLMEEIRRIGSHIVPVGLKGSATENEEWRISYALAESKLIKSLNEYHLLVYIFVKRIVRNLNNKDIDSYHVKNLILWIAEATNPKHFTMENLWHLIFSTITLLRTCVVKKHLPSYMIPEKNLFLHKLKFSDDKNSILQDLNEVIEHLPTIFYKTVYKQILCQDELTHLGQLAAFRLRVITMITCRVEKNMENDFHKHSVITNVIEYYNLWNGYVIIKMLKYYAHLAHSTLNDKFNGQNVLKWLKSTRKKTKQKVLQNKKPQKIHKINSKRQTVQNENKKTKTGTELKLGPTRQLLSSASIQLERSTISADVHEYQAKSAVHKILHYPQTTLEMRGRCRKRKDREEILKAATRDSGSTTQNRARQNRALSAIIDALQPELFFETYLFF